ncbi:hypothetical protein PENTCL1PPCAC_30056, partial [Pristionchus entomophagus]
LAIATCCAAGLSAFDNPHKWETLPLVPHVSGVRVENKHHPLPPAVIGYTKAGETIVEPDTKCTVVIFGYWLQHIEYITFTDSVCVTSEYSIPQREFIVQTETRIEVEMEFADVEESWRLCVKQEGIYGELLLIEDMRTWISTSATIPHHIMPIYVQVFVMLVLLSMSALFSGLNLGLMSLSIQELQLIINSGSHKERRYAEKILPVRKRGNYLLCTILLMNVVVNSAISILFEDLTTGAVAFGLSSLGIVVCGEIIPQSICVKKGLAVGAKTLFLTKFFMWITTPLSWPISKVLDCVLGEEVERYNRKRLIEILKMETKNENKEFAEDLKIAVGAMEIGNKKVRDVMTRIDDAFIISESEVLNEATIAHIIKKGYTRIPVHEARDRNKVISLLFVRDLVVVDPKHNATVGSVASFNKHILRIVDEDMPLPDLLEEFKKGDYHLAMVRRSSRTDNAEGGPFIAAKLQEFKQVTFQPQTFQQDCTVAVVEHTIKPIDEEEEGDEETSFSEKSPLTRDQSSSSDVERGSPRSSRDRKSPSELIGLITLEDIIEEILQAEIIDESDTILDNAHRLKRRTSHRLSEILNVESSTKGLSIHQIRVVERWLRDNFMIFNENYIDCVVLRRLIQANVRRIFVLKKGRDSEPRTICVAEPGIACKRALLLLEGSLDVHFPESGMFFKVGPWASFGDSTIRKIQEELFAGGTAITAGFDPDFVLTASETSKFLQIPFAQIIHAYRVSKFVRNHPKASVTPATKSEELKSQLSAKLQGSLTSLDYRSRKYSDAPSRTFAVSQKKSVAF